MTCAAPAAAAPFLQSSTAMHGAGFPIAFGVIALAWPGGAASLPPDGDAARVELVAQMERSVAVVLAEGRRMFRDRRKIGVAPWEAVGSGVVLSKDGLVLTAAHVVVEGERIRVKGHGMDEPVPARLAFVDEPSDLALLRLDRIPVPLVPARLGDSSSLRKGETVYAIGNPAGLEYSFSAGVVSGRHQVGHVFGGSVQAEVIQTDAALNTGNSGGPLFNRRGEVIAIAQRIMTEGGGSEGLGFGLAIDVVKRILGLDPCVWLGFSGVPLDERWSRALNLPQPGGLLVQRVSPGEAAERAGIRGGHIPVQSGRETVLLGGDVVLRVDGRPILDWIRSPPPFGGPGERHELRLTVLRAGRTLEVPIVEIHRAAW